MFTASYPASFLREDNGKGFHVAVPGSPRSAHERRRPKDTLVQAADCLAEAIAGRIVRGDEIPSPSKAKRGIPNTELAKRLGVSAALVALGKRIVVTFEDAA